MKVPKFNEFITEDKHEKYKVVILTVEFGDKSITAKKFEEEAQKISMKTFLANFKEVSLKFDNGKHFLSDDKKKIEICRVILLDNWFSSYIKYSFFFQVS